MDGALANERRRGVFQNEAGKVRNLMRVKRCGLAKESGEPIPRHPT
jgi:hypothetical protein